MVINFTANFFRVINKSRERLKQLTTHRATTTTKEFYVCFASPQAISLNVVVLLLHCCFLWVMGLHYVGRVPVSWWGILCGVRLLVAARKRSTACALATCCGNMQGKVLTDCPQLTYTCCAVLCVRLYIWNEPSRACVFIFDAWILFLFFWSICFLRKSVVVMESQQTQQVLWRK